MIGNKMTHNLQYGVQLKTFVDINEEQYCVSTVDLGGNLIPYAGFETMIFKACDYKIYNYAEIDEFTDRYKTEQQALIGHYYAIAKLIHKLRGGNKMKFQYGDLVKFTNNYGMYASTNDVGTVQHVDKYGNILVLVESGEFAARFEEVREDDIELIDRLSDEDLELLKEKL